MTEAQPKPKRRILVAMSGGVDSAVAAARLLEGGDEVIGLTLHLWDASGAQQVGRCCSAEDREDARRVCDHLGIAHYVVDERSSFRRQVVDPFVEAYRKGETPSPCVHCNRSLKLGGLAELARQFGAEKVATGHYARLRRDAQGLMRLHRGVDASKDQSYFLFGLPQTVLECLEFPLGEWNKEQVRAEAQRYALPNADKKDSQELCFVPDGDVQGFVQRESGPSPQGEVVDLQGQVLARHQGIAAFTVGQRRGLGFASGEARYVLRILPDRQQVVVGGAEDVVCLEAEGEGMQWREGFAPRAPFEAEVQIRYRHRAAPARIVPLAPGSVRVEFQEAQRALTPGQALVVYAGDEVLGGGFIRAKQSRSADCA